MGNKHSNKNLPGKFFIKFKEICIIGIFMLLMNAEMNSQENSDFKQNGLLFSSQFMALIDAPRISPVVGYKLGRLVYFTGYENIKYTGWNTNRQALKAGVYIYPYKNLHRIKIFHQSLVSYKWHRPDYYAKMFFFHIGSGIDYFIKDNIAVGYDVNLGFGKMKDSPEYDYNFSIDWNSTLTLKVFIWD